MKSYVRIIAILVLVAMALGAVLSFFQMVGII